MTPEEANKELNRLADEYQSAGLPTGYIAVPIHELENLEQARVDLFSYLEAMGISSQGIACVLGITGQMWRVANTKKWD